MIEDRWCHLPATELCVFMGSKFFMRTSNIGWSILDDGMENRHEIQKNGMLIEQ